MEALQDPNFLPSNEVRLFLPSSFSPNINFHHAHITLCSHITLLSYKLHHENSKFPGSTLSRMKGKEIVEKGLSASPIPSYAHYSPRAVRKSLGRDSLNSRERERHQALSPLLSPSTHLISLEKTFPFSLLSQPIGFEKEAHHETHIILYSSNH